ncbi:L-2-amino-thiazoline-4-carboxylic acid hydrolase [Pseudonocardia sp. MH-G8]|uniref:L-2-amino-thiazoline-4-carboxylic acid hydrolase n=1 Tax=Pseudonocardia sp. MH-G8 TaxID=1854588 RepID=UPI000BA03BF5|nr:L-2-amino-thiazoline-4-carboxylic acid hydrolase [Pseudonocardia sp. MH-G8]OZM77086.1 hypothetical protein CFP66_37505 [Pseudonocardia sp. MH-G8]
MALIAQREPDADTSVRAIEHLLEIEAHQFHHIATAFEQEVGVADAHPVLASALREYGAWRGQRIATRHDRADLPRTLVNLVAGWGSGDLHGALELGWGRGRGDDTGVEITLAGTPDVLHLADAARRDLALLWWDNVVRGATEAYLGDAARVAATDTGEAIVVTIRLDDGRPDTSATLTSHVFTDAGTAQRVVRQTVDNRAAQVVLLGRALIAAFDASGEHALRVGIQRFGAERGERLRQRHRAQGLEPHLKHMIDDFDYGGESVWLFRPGGELTPQRWYQDCTFCPFAVVWRELDALDLGYLYDLEFHVAQFKAYHPGIRVRWDRLQTRGDAVCEFRFDLPDAPKERTA